MNKLVATSLESKFYVYDMRTQHPTKGFASLTEKVYYRDLNEPLAGWPKSHQDDITSFLLGA